MPSQTSRVHARPGFIKSEKTWRLLGEVLLGLRVLRVGLGLSESLQFFEGLEAFSSYSSLQDCSLHVQALV